MNNRELKGLFILNLIGIVLILFALIFRDKKEITDQDLRYAEAYGYVTGVDDGMKAFYEYGIENNIFGDLGFDDERFVNIADSTVYKFNLK